MLTTTIAIWFVGIIITAMLASAKNRSVLGWSFCALIFSPLIALILLVMPEKEGSESQLTSRNLRKCPFCAENVKLEAIVCKHCGKDLPAIEIEKKTAPTSHYPGGFGV